MMKKELLKILTYSIKLYDKLISDVCKKYKLTKTEVDVLAFLSNNPEKDTASDIIEYRMISKANVSQAVEMLITKGMLERAQDKKDRRRIHLKLTEKSEEIVKCIHLAQDNFSSLLFEDFSNEEIELYEEFNKKIYENAKRYL